MILGEPARTSADLHFRLFGFPVRVHPFFWIVSLLLSPGGVRKELDPIHALIWVAIAFVSILVHELGHAFVQRYFGGNPWITLYSFGGLASCNDCDRSPGSQILISLAGPFAGFLLAAVVVAILFAFGRVDSFELSWIPVNWVPFESQLDLILAIALFVNIAWGVVNLLPVYPLDGGQVARELFTLKSPRAGIIRSLQLSIAAAILVAIYALSNEQVYTCVMFGFLAYGSYQALLAYQNHWR